MDNIYRELCDLKRCFSSLSESQMEKEVINILENNINELNNILNINVDQSIDDTIVPDHSDATNLPMIKPKRELYVSRFKPHITSSHIEQYLTNKGI